MTAQIVAYRRFNHVGECIDPPWGMPISPLACRHISRVWVAALNRGDYSRIELRFDDGSRAVVKKLHHERNFCRRNTADEDQQRLECRESR